MERRSFSMYERVTIRTIVANASRSVDYLLVNIYNDIFLYTNVAYINNELHFFYKNKEEFNKIDDREILKIKKDLISKTLLLMYLVENRYLYLVDNANVQNRDNDIKFVNESDKQYELLVDLPQDISNFLNTSKRVVIVAQDLITLVENNFKTFGEQQLDESKKQTENSRKAMWASIGTLFIAVITPFVVSLFTDEKEYQARVLESIHQTTEVLESSTENICTGMDSVRETGNALLDQNNEILDNLKSQEATIKKINRNIINKN